MLLIMKNWKKNLFVVWLSQFLAMAGFGCCMPFIPLMLKQNLHIDDVSVVTDRTHEKYMK